MDTNAEKLLKAEKSIRMASILTFCIAAFSLAIALISMRNMHTSAYGFFDKCSFAHFGFMVFFGLMFKLKSRAFAILFLIYYILSRIVLAAITSISGAVFTVDFFIGLAFIVVIWYGMDATFQYQRIIKKYTSYPQAGAQGTYTDRRPGDQQNPYINGQQQSGDQQNPYTNGQQQPGDQKNPFTKSP